MIATINLKDVYYLEKSQLNEDLSQRSLQEVIVDDVLLPLLSDDDYRVRQVVSSTFVKLIGNLYQPADYPDGDPVTGMAVDMVSRNLPSFSTHPSSLATMSNGTGLVFPSLPLPPEFGFWAPFTVDQSTVANIRTGHFFVERNLKLIVKQLEAIILKDIGNRRSLVGGISTLEELTHAFPVTVYSKAWFPDTVATSSAGCGGCDSSLPFVNLLMSLLTTSASSLSTDLVAHSKILSLVGNLVAGMAYQALRTSIVAGATLAGDGGHGVGDWGLLSQDAKPIAMLLEAFLTHLMKLVYILTCVIEDTAPTGVANAGHLGTAVLASNASSSKPVIQTLTSATASLGSLRKKGSRGSIVGLDGTSTGVGAKKGSGGDQPTASSVDPVYGRLYDVLKSAYLSYKVTLEPSSGSGGRFASIVEATLNGLGQVLEVGTLAYIGPRTDELLDGLKCLVSVCPRHSVTCVRQLLKCIFGTNFALLVSPDPIEVTSSPDSEESGVLERLPRLSRQSSSTATTGLRPHYGLYQTCISNPYTQLSQYQGHRSSSGQSQASGHVSRSEELRLWQAFLKKSLERRVTSLLEVKGQAGQPPKTALASHIRSFEPVVIKALKMYTVTADVQLQTEVLKLLGQLVKLHVNYCLLDSDQVFLGFVQKQFEFLESGQISEHTSHLVASIFNFLVLLSYERYQSRTIISVPKIIQLADGLLASGQRPDEYVLPALLPLVEDLFLLRSPGKLGESAKEQEAQREVLVATLLKVASTSATLDLLTLVVISSRRELDDKWRKVSRQVIDALLPLLSRQLVAIDDHGGLDKLHELFECVSPTVFRPVDLLLKTLLAPPREDIVGNVRTFYRWMATVLVVLRTLISQVNEETILGRLDEIRPFACARGAHGLPIIDATHNFRPLSAVGTPTGTGRGGGAVADEEDDSSAEVFLAQYLLQLIELNASHLLSSQLTCGGQQQRSEVSFGGQLFSHLLLYVTHMFQSGSYRRVAKAASLLVKTQSDGGSSGVDIGAINGATAGLELTQPTIILQWCNLLTLLGFDDAGTYEFWHRLVKRTVASAAPAHESPLRRQTSKTGLNTALKGNVTAARHGVRSPHVEVVRRGSLVLLCDFIAENAIADAEQMAWLLVNNIKEVVCWSYELPVKDFISAVHRNPASSGLFLQAINSRCEGCLATPGFVRRLIAAIEYIHPTQSGPLVAFLVEHIICSSMSTSFLVLRSQAENLACDRLEMIVRSESNDEVKGHMSLDDLNKLLALLGGTGKCRRLVSLLNVFKNMLVNGVERTVDEGLDPLSDSQGHGDPVAGRDWFLTLSKNWCPHTSHFTALGPLLNRLPHEDMSSLLSDLKLLPVCLEAGAGLAATSLNEGIAPFSNSNILYKAASNATIGHLTKLVQHVPTVHSGVVPKNELLTPLEVGHSAAMATLFEEPLFAAYLFGFVPTFRAFLNCSSSNKQSNEVRSLVLRVAVLYAEAGSWAADTKSLEYVEDVLDVLGSFVRNEVTFRMLADEQNVTFLYSFVAAVYALTKLG